eukprot:scaffold368_cov127-Isochrysis_galbana.AAC.7
MGRVGKQVRSQKCWIPKAGAARMVLGHEVERRERRRPVAWSGDDCNTTRSHAILGRIGRLNSLRGGGRWRCAVPKASRGSKGGGRGGKGGCATRLCTGEEGRLEETFLYRSTLEPPAPVEGRAAGVGRGEGRAIPAAEGEGQDTPQAALAALPLAVSAALVVGVLVTPAVSAAKPPAVSAAMPPAVSAAMPPAVSAAMPPAVSAPAAWRRADSKGRRSVANLTRGETQLGMLEWRTPWRRPAARAQRWALSA